MTKETSTSTSGTERGRLIEADEGSRPEIYQNLLEIHKRIPSDERHFASLTLHVDLLMPPTEVNV